MRAKIQIDDLHLELDDATADDVIQILREIAGPGAMTDDEGNPCDIADLLGGMPGETVGPLGPGIRIPDWGTTALPCTCQSSGTLPHAVCPVHGYTIS